MGAQVVERNRDKVANVAEIFYRKENRATLPIQLERTCSLVLGATYEKSTSQVFVTVLPLCRCNFNFVRGIFRTERTRLTTFV